MTTAQILERIALRAMSPAHAKAWALNILHDVQNTGRVVLDGGAIRITITKG